jgi:hypothetical protein
MFKFVRSLWSNYPCVTLLTLFPDILNSSRNSAFHRQVITINATKAYRTVEVLFHSLLLSELDGGENKFTFRLLRPRVDIWYPFKPKERYSYQFTNYELQFIKRHNYGFTDPDLYLKFIEGQTYKRLILHYKDQLYIMLVSSENQEKIINILCGRTPEGRKQNKTA